jgi:hypothetical protein
MTLTVHPPTADAIPNAEAADGKAVPAAGGHPVAAGRGRAGATSASP